MPSRALNVVITGDPRPFQKALGSAGGSLSAFGGKTKAVGQRLNTVGSALTKGVTLPLVAMGAGAVKVAADFEQQMSALAAVTNAPKRAVGQLRDAAIDAGAKTAYSAREAALAETELAKGGVSTANILRGGLAGALSLAAAGQLELGDAAAITANSLNLFALDGSRAGHVADALAMAANATTADVDDFGMALSQAGSVAKSAGLNFDQTVVALEALAANGIKNSDAGTSLKTALIQLIKPTDKQRALADKLNLSFVNQHGRLKSLADISTMMRDKLGGMTKAQRTAALATLAGTDGVRTLTALYDAGPDKLNAFAAGLAKNGTAADVARKKQDNLKGKLEQLRGSVETLGIVIGSALLPPLSDLAKKATGVANDIAHAFSSLSPAGQQVVIASAIALAALGPVVGVVGRVVTAFGVLREGWMLLGVAITPLRVAVLVAGAALAIFGGHMDAVKSTLGGFGSVAMGIGTALRAVGSAAMTVLSPILSLVGAFAQSGAGARLLQGAIAALVAGGIAMMVARIMPAVSAFLMFGRAVMSIAGITTVAAIAMQRLRVAIATNPVGILITALGFVAGALGLFSQKTNESRMTQVQYRDAILQTRDAIDRLRDAQQGIKDTDLAAKEAALNLAQAEQNRTRVYRNSKSTALDKRAADLQVARASLENEKAAKRASRAHRDLGASMRKSAADAQDNVNKLRAHRDQLKRDIAAMDNAPPSIRKLYRESGILAGKQKELASVQRDLATEEGRLAGATRTHSGSIIKSLASIFIGGVPPLQKTKGTMHSIGAVRVPMGGFVASILSVFPNLLSQASAWVGRVRDKLKQASPHKRGSPSPNEVVAEGFRRLNDVVRAGYDKVGKSVDTGIGAIRARAGDGRIFPLDDQIRAAQDELDHLQATFDLQDRQAAINAASSAARSPRHHGEKKGEYRRRINEAKKELRDLVREEQRAQQAADIEFRIGGLERLKAFNDAIADIRDSLKESVGTAVDQFIDRRLSNALAAIDQSAAASELASIRVRQTKRQQDREDADISAKMLKARTREQKAIDALTAAQANLVRMQSSGSARLIAAAQRRVQYAQASVAIAKAGTADVEAEQQDLADSRRADALEQQLADARQAAQDRADIARQGFDAETNAYRDSLQAQLDLQIASLANRTQSYQDFANNVRAILGSVGLDFPGSADQEAAIAAGDPSKRPAATMPKKKKRRKKHAGGGRVVARLGELAQLNELGAETAVLPRGTRVITAGETARGSGDNAPTIGELHVHQVGRAADNVEALAQLIGLKLATARR